MKNAICLKIWVPSIFARARKMKNVPRRARKSGFWCPAGPKNLDFWCPAGPGNQDFWCPAGPENLIFDAPQGPKIWIFGAPQGAKIRIFDAPQPGTLCISETEILRFCHIVVNPPPLISARPGQLGGGGGGYYELGCISSTPPGQNLKN